MISIAVNGVCGRMGRMVVGLALEETDIQVAAGLERPGHKEIGADLGTLAGRGKTGLTVSKEMAERVDVLVDFTTPAATAEALRRCTARGIAMVIGTTGHTPRQLDDIKEAARTIPVVLAPNMSVGVNVMFELTRRAAELLDRRYDVEIIEAHHRFKKDAPSGTAKTLVEMVAQGRDTERPQVIYGREGMVGERRSGEIGVHALRAGDIVGAHTVMFTTLGERLEIAHHAHSREGFARGALLAARYVAGGPPGLHGMRDVLGLT